MKHYILFIWGVLLSTFVLGQNSKYQEFFVGTYTSEGAEGINLCKLNTETGEINLENTFTGIENPSFLRLSPNKKFLYAVSEAGDAGSFVYAYEVVNNELKFLNKQSSNGQGPCHVDVSSKGSYVAVACYGGGTTSIYPVLKNGKLMEAFITNVNSGTGPVKDRQAKPHAHSIKFSPFESLVFSADLGTDQLDIYQLNFGGLKKAEQKFVKLPPGSGPRHFDFHPNGKVIYVINELNSTVSAIRKEGNDWKVFQNISTLPKDFKGESYCADIHVSKDGKYVYGSNRGHNSIAVFEVNPTDQSLKLLETVSVEGNWPRNFGITPDGTRMLVANQRSSNITVFNIDKETGRLEFTGKEIKLPAPVCIEFL
ncbi:lactonase family protein [Maribellus sediminis]|uniref:lactonase family protein n=1 Tax=Maribellus sediminis TaxID=2696285 RepID=UPI00142F3CFF|nr:lactonase family protein [Maribellus sediminis]